MLSRRPLTKAARPGTQAGAALIVTLVLLLVLTITGVAGMSATILQERMAGNRQDSAQVFEAAESALRLCGDRVLAGDSAAEGEAPAQEFFDFGSGADAFTPADAELFVPSPASPLTALGDTEYQLRCLIEYTGPVDAARTGGSVRGGTASSSGYEGYRVTAAGARIPSGSTDTARPTVVLQSDVVK